MPRFLHSRGGALGAAWLAFLFVASLTVSLWQPYGTDQQNLLESLKPPSGSHWLGTDEVGRDVLTRLFAAGGQTLLASGLTVLVALAIALPLVLISAEYGTRVERWVSRGSEVMLALPAIVILLAVVGTLGAHMYEVMAVLGVLVSAAMYRVLLGSAQSLHRRLYVDAARIDGASRLRVNLKYVLPGLGSLIAVQLSQLFAVSILIQSGLAFLGFGPPAPAPSWGGMIATASQNVYNDPWLMVPAGVVLAVTVIAANMLADAIASTLDHELVPPRRKRRRDRRAGEGTRGVDDKAPAAAPAPAAVGLLEVNGISITAIGGPALVTDIRLSLSPGKVLGLVGESGCGKTVTALSTLGLLPPTIRVNHGTIVWQGRTISTMSERALRPLRGTELAMIPQDPMLALDPLFTIGSQLVGPIRRFHKVDRREARRRAIALLSTVEIRDPERVMKAHPHQLSGGMAQRVVIALAISGSPKLLVADEPTTALDVTTQAGILDLLRQLVADTGVSVLLVSHDMGVIADICDEVAVMYAGQVVEFGPVASVLETPQHPYTMALLAANPHIAEGEQIPRRLPTIPGTVPNPGEWPVGCRFAARCRFVQPACQAAVDLEPAGEGTAVRCVRSVELKESGMTWVTELADPVDADGVPR